MKNRKEALRLKRHKRIKLRFRSSAERPRLEVRRSLKHISAQVIDDATGKTVFSLSTLSKEMKAKLASGGNIKAAEYLGEAFGRRAKEKGISKVVFDRAGYIYHGRVKAFAEALRKQGIEF